MFELSLIESRGTKRGRNKWLAVPVSLFLHASIVIVIGMGTYWFAAEDVTPPQIPVILLAPPPPPPPPPPPAKRKSIEQPKPEPKPEQPQQMVQPVIVPPELPKPEEIPDNGEVEGGMEGGVEGGVPGGVVGGVLGGVPGGVVGGILGEGLLGPYVAGEEGVTLPVIIPETKVQAAYPEAARKSKIEGRVILQAVVKKEGTVGNIIILRTPGNNLGFEESAIAAVQQWRFKPALKNGKPVDVYFTVEISFYLL